MDNALGALKHLQGSQVLLDFFFKWIGESVGSKVKSLDVLSVSIKGSYNQNT